MAFAETLAWLGLALIHLLPALAAVRPAMLERLYGVAPGQAAHLLLEHRALLFGAVVAGCLWAAVDPQPRPPALGLAGISVIGFLLVYAREGFPAGPLRLIAWVDLAALPLLGFLFWRQFAG